MSRELGPGEVLERRYRIVETLCSGGMSTVYLAEHALIRRPVVVKVLHALDVLSAEVGRRLETEAQAAARIGSPHVVEVLDVGMTKTGEPFLVLERLAGETLKDRLERGSVAPGELVGIVRQLLRGLAAAHGAGVVHLDIKPGNVFLTPSPLGDGELVKILDFGIAKVLELEGDPGRSVRMVVGTAHYMSPEQALGEPVDHRSDVYSVGVLLYRAVTGRVPFAGTPTAEVPARVVFDQPPHPCVVAPALDPSLADIVVQAMARDPAQRFQTADELREALDRWLDGATDERITAIELAAGEPPSSEGRVGEPPSSELPSAGARPAAVAPAPAARPASLSSTPAAAWTAATVPPAARSDGGRDRVFLAAVAAAVVGAAMVAGSLVAAQRFERSAHAAAAPTGLAVAARGAARAIDASVAAAPRPAEPVARTGASATTRAAAPASAPPSAPAAGAVKKKRPAEVEAAAAPDSEPVKGAASTKAAPANPQATPRKVAGRDDGVVTDFGY